MANKSRFLGAILSAALALNPLISLSQSTSTVKAPTRAEKEAMLALENTDHDSVVEFLKKGDYAGASKYVESKKKRYSEQPEFQALSNGISHLEGLIQTEKDAQGELWKIMKQSGDLKQEYHNLTYEGNLKAFESAILIPLFELKEKYSRISRQDLNKKNDGRSNEILKAIQEVQFDFRHENEGRRDLSKLYSEMGTLIDDFNKDDLSNKKKSKSLAESLKSYADKIKGIMAEHGLNDKDTQELITGWETCYSGRIAQLENPQIPTLAENKEENKKDANQIQISNDIRSKYGPRDPIEISLGSYSKSSSGKTPASTSGLDMTLEASFNKNSFGTNLIPELKDMFYGTLKLNAKKGSGEVPGIGTMSQDDDRSLEIITGIKFFGDKNSGDSFWYLGGGLKTGVNNRTIDFSNSNTQNALTSSYHGPLLNFGINAKKVALDLKYSPEKSSTLQELERNGRSLYSESSESSADRISLKVYTIPMDELRVNAYYNYLNGRNFEGTNGISNLGFELKGDIYNGLTKKLIDKSKAAKAALKDTSFNFSFDYESGNRHTARQYGFGVTKRFQGFHLPRSNLNK